MIEWENGEITTEPLAIIAADDPVTCTIYAREHGLLDKPGWKRFKHIVKHEKHFSHQTKNRAKLMYFSTAARYKYGFEIPRTYEHAIILDQRNWNTLWGDAITFELTQIGDYDMFIDEGHHTKVTAPSGFKKIRVYFICDVNHDGRHKARLVDDGHLIQIHVDSAYSGLVSLRGFLPTKKHR
jgi:hypothetical protein